MTARHRCVLNAVPTTIGQFAALAMKAPFRIWKGAVCMFDVLEFRGFER